MSTGDAEGVWLGWCWFPGSVQANAIEVSGSRLDRRSTRAAGVALTSAPRGAESLPPGRAMAGCEAAYLQRPMWTDGQRGSDPVAGHPFATLVVAWSDAAAARRGQSDCSTSPCGGQTRNDHASWLRPDLSHAGRARQRMCPSRSP